MRDEPDRRVVVDALDQDDGRCVEPLLAGAPAPWNFTELLDHANSVRWLPVLRYLWWRLADVVLIAAGLKNASAKFSIAKPTAIAASMAPWIVRWLELSSS